MFIENQQHLLSHLSRRCLTIFKKQFTQSREQTWSPSCAMSSFRCDTDASQWRQLNAWTSINVRGPHRTHKQTFTFNWRVAWLTNGRPSEFRNVSMPPPSGPVHDPRVGESKRMKKKRKKFPSRARVHPGEQRATRCWINRTGIAPCCIHLW